MADCADSMFSTTLFLPKLLLLQFDSVGIATAAGVLFLPKLAARKLNDPKFVKNLIRGLKKHSADDLKMQKFMTLLSTQLTAEGINSQFVPGDPATSPEEARIGGSTSVVSPTNDIF